MKTVRVELQPHFFHMHQERLLTHGALTATTFRYPSGVAALRLESDRGSVILLPFQGQQIWSVAFDDGAERRTLTMNSMVKEPQPTREFLATFGGFLQHCGITGMGGPGPTDSHPLHGELPNAPFQHAHLLAGEDEHGPFLALGGAYRHTVAFGVDYTAAPHVTLRAGSTLVQVEMAVTNHKRTPMELFYLAHVNFLPVNHGRLLYTARRTPEHVRVRASIPSHIQPGPGYAEFLETLRDDPTQHEVLRPEMACDPEVVFFIDYLADKNGWAHTMQVHPGGSADYVRHRPAELPKATRWISRTPDQDAIALVEVGTAEPEGATAERAKGNVVTLEAGATWRCAFDAGLLMPAAAQAMATHIIEVVQGNA